MNRYIKNIKYFLLFLSLTSIIVYFYPQQLYGYFWLYSWILLIVVMVVRPLNDIFPKCKIFSILLKFRRELGILVWVFWIAHVIGFVKMMEYDSIFWLITSENTWDVKGGLFWGMLALLVTIPLLITSNWVFTKILWRNWKLLQRWAYLMFILVAIHIYLIKWEIWPIIVITVWFILYSVAFIKNKKKKGIISTSVKRLCVPCWYIYDENIWDVDSWINPWTRFEDIPDDWLCPVCWVGKSDFILLEWEAEVNEWKIISKEFLTEDVIELRLMYEKELFYISGQYQNFIFTDDGGEFSRSYSIASKKGKKFTFLIKLKPNWRASNLLKDLRFWDKVKVWNIFWNFKLRNNTNKKIFIATWTWLAPIYSMMINTFPEVEKELYFGVAMKRDIFYEDKLKEIENLKVNIYLSKEEARWYNYGRVDLDNIVVDDKTEVYICWNPIMVNEKADYFENKIWKENVFYEKF